MFSQLPNGTLIDLDPKQIISLQRSINTPLLSFGGPMEPSRCAVLSMYTRSGNYRLFVHIGVVNPHHGAVGTLFRSDHPEVPLSHYPQYEAAAVEMAEGQGFHMERVDFKGLPPGEQMRILQTLPFAGYSAQAPPLGAGSGLLAAPANQVRAAMGSGLIATPVDISREITLPTREAITQLGKLLSLF